MGLGGRTQELRREGRESVSSLQGMPSAPERAGGATPNAFIIKHSLSELSLLSADFPQEKKQLFFSGAGGPQGRRQVLCSQRLEKQVGKF